MCACVCSLGSFWLVRVKIGELGERNKKENSSLDINCVPKSRPHNILEILIIKVNKHRGYWDSL